MLKLAILTLSVLSLLATLSCKSYSTGLEKSLVFADEAAAAGVLRTVALAQQSYSATNTGNYGTFQELAAGGFLDSRFNSDHPAIKDYAFTMEVGKDADGPFYRCNADPSRKDAQGGRHFYVDSSASTIHVNATQPASKSDPEYFNN